MTATKENACLGNGTSRTGGGNNNLVLPSTESMRRVPHSDSTTQRGARQAQFARYATNGDVFQRAKERVSVMEATRRLGLEPNRAGKIRCFHNPGDENPSLQLYPDTNSWYCFRCNCGGDAIDLVSQYRNIGKLEAAEWLLGEESPLPSVTTPKAPKAAQDFGTFEREHVYPGGQVKKVFYRQKDGKHAVWYHMDGGQWKKGKGNAPHILYERGTRCGDVFIVEGEKDAETLEALYNGFIYVVSGENGAGPGKWRPEYTEQLKAAGVESAAIFSDNDDVGRAYAEETAAALKTFMESVKVLDLRKCWPECPEHGDVSDLISKFGKTVARGLIDELYNDTPEWEPEPAAAQTGFENFENEETDENGFLPLVPFEPSTRDNLPMFPVDRLPQGTAKYIKAVSESVQVSPDMAATVALGTGATTVQGKYNVHPIGDWREPLNVYAVTIAPPSERKSPVYDEETRPIELWEDATNKECAPLVAEWRSNVKILEGKIAQAEKVCISGRGEGDSRETLRDLQAQLEALKQDEVKPVRLLADDSTPESIINLLANNGGKMSIFSPEGSTVFAIAGGRYSNGEANLNAFLNGYSGDTIRVTRMTRPDETIRKPALTLNLMVQPQVIQKVMENADFNGTGFLARFLYCFPRSTVGHRAFRVKPISEQVRAGYSNTLNFLLDLNNAVKEPYSLELTPEAVQEAERMHNEIEARLTDDLEPIAAWAGKWHGQIFRIAGIIHCLKCAEQRKFPEEFPIDRETVLNAQEIGRYYLEHAKAAFSMGSLTDTEAERDAKAIWKKLKGKREISRRDLHQMVKGRAGFEKAEGLDAGLEELERRHYIRMGDSQSQNSQNTQKGRGRHSTVILINPKA